MKKQATPSTFTEEEITRKMAIKKIGNYGKFTALTALGTFIFLNPQMSQAGSTTPPVKPGDSFF
tara:strand:- start:294 stop:485 length:192 start_codon:yes stop_codon:yes gene_type:complete